MSSETAEIPQPEAPRQSPWVTLGILLRRQWQRRSPAWWLPLLLLLFFNKMALSNLILARGDTFLYFYPYWEAAAEALGNGRIPFWNPHLFMGAPLLANSQVGFFYPLNWPLWLLLPTPYAVSASILLHLLIAGIGAYLAAQRTLYLERSAALVTAVLYSLGGYVTAQVEHVNQLQGMAWLPWFFVVLAYAADEKAVSRLVVLGRSVLGLGVLFALQLLAGHSQTAFITGVGVLVWSGGLVAGHLLHKGTDNELLFRFQFERFKQRAPLVLLLGVGLALMLAAVQLLPTLELAQLSSRQGGLLVNEVLSFSLHPLLLSQSLLPGIGQSLFSEYEAALPITGILLALIGGWQWRRWRGVLPAAALALVGLFLALGQFNPLYWLLARVPGFDLFRAPARWLVLYALGMALLAGLGWQIVQDRWLLRNLDWRAAPERARETIWQTERPLRIGFWVVAGLIAWAFAAPLLTQFVPTGPEAPVEAPNRWTLAFWLVELLLGMIWLRSLYLARAPQRRLGWRTLSGPARNPWPLAGLALLTLFAATRTHPYNNLTTPQAYFDLRPSTARLLAETADATPPARFLSLSNIFFDPGDQAELDAIYADQLPAAARYDYTVAVKQQEIIAPNLSLTHELAALDGFDGGVLPMASYSDLASLLLPPGETTTDGRLRELLTAVPAPRWLDLFNVGYVITDKTGDEWRRFVPGVNFSAFFDRQHPTTLAAGESKTIAALPSFPSTALYLITEGDVGALAVTTADGAAWTIPPMAMESGYVRFGWPRAVGGGPFTEATVTDLALRATGDAPWRVLAATLVNEQTGVFQSLVVGDYRLIHSGDVKIYENLDVLPRAFLLADWQWRPDRTAALATMAQPDWDGRETAVLTGDPTAQPVPPGGGNPGTAVIMDYAPEAVTIQVNAMQDALLLLSDAQYPGWRATVNGRDARIYTANGLFRAVFVPAGTHEVQFTFESEVFGYGRFITLIGLSVSIILAIAMSTLWLSGGRTRRL